ncbi:hypothetical protein, partial [Pseudomonas sp. GL-R-19]|uniref:hypothetical protein n=1 Tax=Pseudomonas sp. GL-R-19 TaxID=2832391 RepID=UPI001CBEBF45
LAKAFIAVDISLNGRNFELKRKLAHGNTAKSQGWCPTFGVQSSPPRSASPGNGLKELARFLQVPLISP